MRVLIAPTPRAALFPQVREKGGEHGVVAETWIPVRSPSRCSYRGAPGVDVDVDWRSAAAQRLGPEGLEVESFSFVFESR